MKPSVKSCHTGSARTSGTSGASVPRSSVRYGSDGTRDSSAAAISGRYSRVSQNSRCTAMSYVTTTNRRATRRSSAIPAARSDQWCTVSTARATANCPVSKGSSSARPIRQGAAPAGRWARIAADGSTASSGTSAGS